MTVNESIIGALSCFGHPVEPGVYLGKKPIYFTFNSSTIPADFGDDAPAHERVLVQVHLFCPRDFNSTDLRRKIKKNIFDSGFTWPEMEDAGSDERASSPAGAHFVFEFEGAEGVE